MIGIEFYYPGNQLRQNENIMKTFLFAWNDHLIKNTNANHLNMRSKYGGDEDDDNNMLRSIRIFISIVEHCLSCSTFYCSRMSVFILVQSCFVSHHSNTNKINNNSSSNWIQNNGLLEKWRDDKYTHFCEPIRIQLLSLFLTHVVRKLSAFVFILIFFLSTKCSTEVQLEMFCDIDSIALRMEI